MFKRLAYALVICCVLIAGYVAQSQASDGIPDNCETASADRINIFARYEPHNQRLVLVDWSTGADVQVIATGLATTVNPTWSGDCRYLAVAVQVGSTWDTVVYDVTTNTRVGAIPDAQGRPHHLT